MKNENIIRKYRGERIIMLLSYLETLPENSSFISRLMYASTEALIQLKHRRLNIESILSILKNGIVQLEDPQEVMFTQQVGSPYGSYTVFPGVFMFYQDNLTRLLNIAGLCQIDKKKLSVVYFLLSVSDMLARKSRCKRYDVGEPERQEVFIPNEDVINKAISSVYIQNSEMQELCKQYDISEGDFGTLVCKASRKELRRDIEDLRYSDRVTLSPFLNCVDGYILLHPCGLLHSAYYLCKSILKDLIGFDNLKELMQISITNEIGCIINKKNGLLSLRKVNEEGNDALLCLIDSIHVIAIIPVVAEKTYQWKNIREAVDNYISHHTRNAKVILQIVVYTQIEDNQFGLELSGNDIIALSIDDFAAVLSRTEVSLKDLYYYMEDKRVYTIPPMSQEADLLAYYISNKCSFYQEHKPDWIIAEIGTALSMRKNYYESQDIRYVYCAYIGHFIPVHHFGDVPKNLPVYAPLYAPENFRLMMVELGQFHLFMIPDVTIKNGKLCSEIFLSFALWLYGVQVRKNLKVLKDDMALRIGFGQTNSINSHINERYISIKIKLDTLTKSENEQGEELLFQQFVSLLVYNGILNSGLTADVCHSLFEESHGHFIPMGRPNPLLMNDGIDDCYFVSERWEDKILDEIASKLDKNGKVIRLSNEESKATMKQVISYLRTEADRILKEIGSKSFLMRCLILHHGMIYWSQLSQARFKQLQSAYQYIGSDFEGQEEYLNKYAEVNVLTQGIIEHIVLNNLHVQIDDTSFDSFKLDRLFAILHHLSNLGVYFDSLNMGLPDSELIILENGRIVLPLDILSLENKYFMTLRQRGLRYPEVMRAQESVLPRFSIDIKDKNFNDAFVAEFGLTFLQYRDIVRNSIEYSEENKKPVISLSKDVFIEKILIPVSDNISSFWNNFVLSKDVDKDRIQLQDTLLQRYNRSIQITTRPWIEYDGNVCYSTKVLYNNFAILTERIDNGTLKSSSRKMQKYLGDVNKWKGQNFTIKLKEFYEALKDKDIFVEVEVKIQPNKKLKADKNYGDIDLLLINTKLKKIVCIEAKDYSEARTGYDLLLQDCKILKALPKVEVRDEWCREHVNMFKSYSSEVDDTYNVKTWFVTYYEPAYRYVKHSTPSPIDMLSAFEIIRDPYCVFD